MIYRAHSALQGFFESWFDIPTSIYPAMPIYVMMQVVYGITMLARWAKILGPGHSPRRRDAPPDILTSQPMVWDPSAMRPPVPEKKAGTVTGMGTTAAPAPPPFERPSDSTARAAISPKGNGLTTTTTTPPYPPADAANTAAALPLTGYMNPPPQIITNPSQIPASQFRESADPGIPGAVARLKAGLQAQQPGLNLDIVGILATLARRCEDVHEELTRTSGAGGGDGGGAWHNDVWYFCAKKVLVARAKLERWAEIIASGGLGGEGEEREGNAQTAGVGAERHVGPGSVSDQQPPLCQGGDAGFAAFQRQIETAGQGILLPSEPMPGDEAWRYGDVWTDDLFGQLDPSLWVTDGGDWSMALLG